MTLIAFEFAETGRGWITMTIRASEKEMEVGLSSVFDPLPGLLTWAARVATSKLPQALSIDEEGYGKQLSVEEHEGLVQLVIRPWTVPNRPRDALVFSCEVEPTEMSRRLVDSMQSFAEAYSGTWRRDYHPRELDFRGAREHIRGAG